MNESAPNKMLFRINDLNPTYKAKNNFVFKYILPLIFPLLIGY